MDPQPKQELFQSDFVYAVSESPFCSYSVDVDPKEPRYIVVSGYIGSETTFHEIVTPTSSDVNDTKCNFKLNFKSFTKDYNKKNANLEVCGLSRQKIINSVVTKDNKYIVILPSNGSYNIYDIENDLWMNDGNITIQGFNHQSRCLMIDDRILVVSVDDYLIFYVLNDKMKFTFIEQYNICDMTKNKHKYKYCSHGICCIKSNCTKETYESQLYSIRYDFKLMLFGGFVHCVALCDTFMQFDVSITVSSGILEGDKIDKEKKEKKEKKEAICKVKERSLNGNKMTLSNMTSASRLYDFSTFVVTKNDGNPVIVMIGGVLIAPGYETSSLVTYDVQENSLEAHSNVCILYSFDLYVYNLHGKTCKQKTTTIATKQTVCAI